MKECTMPPHEFGNERRRRQGQRQTAAPSYSDVAEHAGFELIGEHYDAGGGGAAPIEGRPGFEALFERIMGSSKKPAGSPARS